VELADESPWPTRSASSRAIAAYIEQFYNCGRWQSRLGYQTPVAFEERRRAG
jgi:transposase InsO family protein